MNETDTLVNHKHEDFHKCENKRNGDISFVLEGKTPIETLGSIAKVIQDDSSITYKKEDDYNKTPHDDTGNRFNNQTSVSNQAQLETVSSKNGPVKMMTLGSNNNVFMQSRTNNIHPIYTAKELPQFLQESLAEALSKVSIVDNNVDKTVEFIDYEDERHLPDLTALITKDLSEPYSIYTYRYFLHNWPKLSFLAYCDGQCVGAVVCKLDQHRKNIWRGYIAMLVVHKDFRRFKIGSKLVQKSIRRMVEQGCDEVVLETEVTNKAALNLYENLGFVRDKRLLRYYLNGVDAWRLKLWLI